MGNIIDYVNCFQYTFSERGFNDVDSLVLCQLSYLKMKHLLPGLKDEKEFIPFREVLKKENAGQIFADERYREDNRKLTEAVLGSRRFADLRLNYYVDILDKEMEVQFSAVTYLLGEETEKRNLYYIAYRGTDENLVGWKEDSRWLFRSRWWDSCTRRDICARRRGICRRIFIWAVTPRGEIWRFLRQ